MQNEITVKEAMQVITKAIRTDPSYRQGWSANIAVQFQDAYKKAYQESVLGFGSHVDVHKISNMAAEAFLDLLCHE